MSRVSRWCRGRPLNAESIIASRDAPCRREHPVLGADKRLGAVPLGVELAGAAPGGTFPVSADRLRRAPGSIVLSPPPVVSSALHASLQHSVARVDHFASSPPLHDRVDHFASFRLLHDTTLDSTQPFSQTPSLQLQHLTLILVRTHVATNASRWLRASTCHPAARSTVSSSCGPTTTSRPSAPARTCSRTGAWRSSSPRPAGWSYGALRPWAASRDCRPSCWPWSSMRCPSRAWCSCGRPVAACAPSPTPSRRSISSWSTRRR